MILSLSSRLLQPLAPFQIRKPAHSDDDQDQQHHGVAVFPFRFGHFHIHAIDAGDEAHGQNKGGQPGQHPHHQKIDLEAAGPASGADGER